MVSLAYACTLLLTAAQSPPNWQRNTEQRCKLEQKSDHAKMTTALRTQAKQVQKSRASQQHTPVELLAVGLEGASVVHGQLRTHKQMVLEHSRHRVSDGRALQQQGPPQHKDNSTLSPLLGNVLPSPGLTTCLVTPMLRKREHDHREQCAKGTTETGVPKFSRSTIVLGNQEHTRKARSHSSLFLDSQESVLLAHTSPRKSRISFCNTIR